MQEQVLDQMQAQIELWGSKNDPRNTFLRCYQLMTGNMLKAVDLGRFSDGPWVKRLLVRFADYYFDAVDGFERGTECPKVWCEAFDLTLNRNLHVLQSLLLGINAHINYDLVFCLAELLETEWPTLTPSQRILRLEDHRMVNQIIGETIDQVQDEIIEQESRHMDLVDRLFGRLDERLLSVLVTSWREKVWESSVCWLEESTYPGKELVQQKVEKEALEKIKWIALL